MQEEIYTLDGTNCSFVTIQKAPGGVYVRYPFDNKYRNEGLLRLDTTRMGINDYEIGVDINGEIYPLSIFQEIQPGIYQAFIDDTIVSIIPTVHERVMKCGYFSFTDTPFERITDYKEGSEINKRVYIALREANSYLFKCGYYKSCCRDSSLVYMNINTNIAPLKYTTMDNVSLRIMRGFELIKINELRKSCNEYVFPFNGKIDKYKSIYYCFTKDKHDHTSDKEQYETIESFEILIMEYLKENYPELNPKIINVPVKFLINV